MHEWRAYVADPAARTHRSVHRCPFHCQQHFKWLSVFLWNSWKGAPWQVSIHESLLLWQIRSQIKRPTTVKLNDSLLNIYITKNIFSICPEVKCLKFYRCWSFSKKKNFRVFNFSVCLNSELFTVTQAMFVTEEVKALNLPVDSVWGIVALTVLSRKR